jgi:ATP-dependent DNA helicase PIF1
MRQRQALSVMMGGANVFLTGAPGAGKTYVLNQFVELARQNGKNVAVTASTGIAATHIGGTTIHSWSGMGIKSSLDKHDLKRLAGIGKLVKRYNAADILVIDEVSMLDGERLDTINQLAKVLRRDEQPFGGLQVILVGDLFQLPPVNRGSDQLDFTHTSQAWQELDPQICYITEQHRQSGTDGLLELLEAMRSGDFQDFHEALLTERLSVAPPTDTPVTRLYAHNVDVDTINDQHRSGLDGDSQLYEAQSKGRAAKVEQLQKGILAPEVLELKIGAEVMFIANDFGSGFVNGSRGRVIGFYNDLPQVKLASSQRIITVEPHSWSLNEDQKKLAEVSQLPLRLAWAITIHKSQGMSLDAAEIDLSKTFTPGMGYVGLSRVRSLQGIYLRGINAMALSLHPDIYEFDKQLRQVSTRLANTTLDLPDQPAPKTNKATSLSPIDQTLFSALKQWRLARAKADGVSAFIVAHNSLLEAIASRRPATPGQLLGLTGFGSHKLDKYGQDILSVVAKHTQAGNT